MQELALLFKAADFGRQTLELSLQAGKPFCSHIVPGPEIPSLQPPRESPPHWGIENNRQDWDEENQNENHLDHGD